MTTQTVARYSRPVSTSDRSAHDDAGSDLESVRFGDLYRHDFHIQVMRTRNDIDRGVYLSTFQAGRGQHITSLTVRQARDLAKALLRAAEAAERRDG